MADESVKLILELENKAKKDFNNLNKEIKELKKQAKDTGKEVDGIDKGFKKTGKSTKTTNKSLKASGAAFKGIAAGAAAAGAALLVVVNNSIKLNKELRELSTLSGVGFENFQLIANQAKALGINADVTADAINDLTLKIDEAANLGSGAAVDSFKLLGVNLNEIASQDQVQRLETFRQALAGVDEQTRRLILDELGSDALIKFGSALDDINLNLEEVRKNANVAFITEEESQKIADLNAEISKIGTNFSVLGAKVTSDLAPALTSALKSLNEFISTINDNETFQNLERILGIVKELFVGLAEFIINLTGVVKSSAKVFGNVLFAELNQLALDLNNFTKDKFDLQIFSDEKAKEIAENVEEGVTKANIEAEKGAKNINKTLDDKLIRQYSIKINADPNLVGAEGILLKKLLKGEEILEEQKVDLQFEINKLSSEEVKEFLQQRFNETEFKVNVKAEVESTDGVEIKPPKISTEFLETIRQAQIEVLKLQGNFTKAFDIEIAPLQQKLDTLIKQANEYAEALKKQEGTDASTIRATEYDNEIAALRTLIELKKQQALLEEAGFSQDLAEQEFDLGLITEEDFIEKLDLIGVKLKETFGEESVEFQSFIQNLQDIKAELDTFGQISLATFSKFSEGFGKAVTDSLLYGKSLKDGLGNLLQSIIQQLIQAAIQALIFSAILSSTGLGGAQTANMGFGDIFKQQFAGNLGVSTFHNGGKLDGSDDSRNSTRVLNLADPSRSLLPQERLIVAKTDESVIKTNELNSPTGVGSNQPMQPEVKISNYITDDVMTSFLRSDAAVDEIVNIINRNSDRTR